MRYFIKKVLVLFLTLFIISVLTFASFHIIPGDSALLILGTEATEEQLSELRHEMGIDKSLKEQYVSWISGILKGDMGTSLKYKKSVKSLVASRLGVTIALGTMSIFVIIIFGIGLGIYSAKKNDRPILNFLTMLGTSIPNFYLSVIVIWFFGLTLHLFVPGKAISAENPAGLLFPVITIAIPETAILVKYVRTAVLNEKNQGYVRTARSKGNSETAILFRHILKNAIVAVFPLLGMIAGSVFSGSIIVEQIFGISGIGRLLISSVSSRDFPLTQALVLYVGSIVVIINFLVDIAVQLLDPRIRLEKK